MSVVFLEQGLDLSGQPGATVGSCVESSRGSIGPGGRSRFLNRSLAEWLASLPLLGLLVLTLVIGTGEMLHGQLLRLGAVVFNDSAADVQYFMLRAAPIKPACDSVDSSTSQSKRSSPDDVDALFTTPIASEAATAASREAAQAAAAICAREKAQYQRLLVHQTSALVVFRVIEKSFFELFRIGTDNRPLILLLMLSLASIITTLNYHHIAIRPPRFRRDFLLQSISQSIATGLLLYSCVAYLRTLLASGAGVENPWLHAIWIGLAAVLLSINLKRIVRPATPIAFDGNGRWAQALMTCPLYAVMAIVSGGYFLLKGHAAGLAIYADQLMSLPTIFLNLGLFIWAGMLLKQSRLADLFMNMLRPWRLSPQLLTYIVLLAAALPTAYTGASGIFVIAAGGIVYHEVRASGGSRQFALAATAMSGSLGVVLRPCLLVVLIAALNKQVTTDGLYHWGLYVFLLTSTLFFLASQALRTQPASIAAPRIAVPATLRALVPTLPFIALTIGVVAFYRYALDTPLNEGTAPTIVPVLMVCVLVFERLFMKADDKLPDYGSHRQQGLEPSIRYATNETIGHIGALLSLMTFSLAIGGLIERSELMMRFPQMFGSPWSAMAFLLVTKVVLGAIMDPFGAVVLVSGTLAPIAYANHIDPVHFWMMVLVAFELGYLLPPVALNQLLMRQVIGESEVALADAEVRHLGFFRRRERWITPLVVMSLSLAIVAFGPLLVHDVGPLNFVENWFSPPGH